MTTLFKQTQTTSNQKQNLLLETFATDAKNSRSFSTAGSSIRTERSLLQYLLPDLVFVFTTLLLAGVAGVGVYHTLIFLISYASNGLLSIVLPLTVAVLSCAVFLLSSAIHSLVALIAVMVGTVGIFLLEGAEFLAYIFLIVYVGAVSILFLFVVMLLNVTTFLPYPQLIKGRPAQLLAIAIAAALLARLMYSLRSAFQQHFFLHSPFQEGSLARNLEQYVNAQHLDITSFFAMYTDLSSLFLLITFVLLTALLGAIVLATTSVETKE
jgi:NADH-quinone oxidoreductase subunit J